MPARPDPTPHVLLAEDDAATAAVLHHLLVREGFSVCVCAEGSRALEHLATESFSLVVAAAGLPGVNGLDVLRHLRGAPETRSVPFVLLAWPGNDALIARAFRAGAADVLVRPFSLVEAAARLGRLVEQEA